MSIKKKYNGNFYKYNVNQQEILFYLRNIKDDNGNIIKDHVLLPIGNYKDLIGNLSPNQEISFITEVLLEKLEQDTLGQFEQLEIVSLNKV